MILAQLLHDLAYEDSRQGIDPRADNVAKTLSGQMAESEKIKVDAGDLQETNRVEIKPGPLASRSRHAPGQMELRRRDKRNVASLKRQHFFTDHKYARALIAIAKFQAIMTMKVSNRSVSLRKEAVPHERKFFGQWDGSVNDAITRP